MKKWTVVIHLQLLFYAVTYLRNEFAHAYNGLKLISSGTRAASMGGADIANSLDTSVLNINPSVITRFDPARIDIHFGNALTFSEPTCGTSPGSGNR